MSSVMRFDEWQDSNGVPVYDAGVRGAVPQIGLVHIKTEAFTSASSVNVDDVFSSEFLAYQVFLFATGSASGGELRYNGRLAGADVTTSTAARHFVETTNSAGPTRNYSTGQTSLLVGRNENAMSMNMTIFKTGQRLLGRYSGGYSSAGFLIDFGGDYNSTALDGFKLTQSSGTFTGKVVVAGIKE